VTEFLHDHGHVVAHVLQAHLSVAQSRPAVAVQVDRDDLAHLGQRREPWFEQVDRAEPAVQQQERLAVPMDLVVVADAVGLDVSAAGHLLLRSDVSGCRFS